MGRLDFARGGVARRPTSDTTRPRRPCSLPGCASNAYTFDVAPSFSLARALAREGHDVFVVECRGVGFSRPWRSPASGRTRKRRAQAARAHVRGDFDYDTYLREDLPVAAGYVAAVTGEERLGAVGHSMGGMLVMNARLGPRCGFRSAGPRRDL